MTMDHRSLPDDVADPTYYTCSNGQTLLAPVIVAKMKRVATGRTDEALNATFGISYNTWRKVIAGIPIRASVAWRLVERVRGIGETALIH